LIRRKNEQGNQTGGYLDPEKRNIRTLRLRGEESDGLFMPLSSLKEFCDITALKEGDTVSTLNGIVICEKFIPKAKTPRKKSDVPKSKTKFDLKNYYPFFAQHSDTSQLAYNLSQFKQGDKLTLTLKMHGTSQRTAYTLQKTLQTRNIIQRLLKRPIKINHSWNYVSGTRRTTLTRKSIDDGGYYGDNQFRMKYHELFKGRLRKGEEVFYEVVGYVNPSTTIMATCDNKKINDKEFIKKYGDKTTFTYGCDTGENEIYVYRMTMTNEDGDVVEYPWDLVKIRCEQMGVKHVLELDRFDFTAKEDLMIRANNFVVGADPIGETHIREGVVVRVDNKEKFTAYKHKSTDFKILEGIIKETATEPDIEEVEEIVN
jgi:RNA ligase.